MIGWIVAAIAVLAVAYPHVRYRWRAPDAPVTAFGDIRWRTGDIVMTRYDLPVVYRGSNGWCVTPFVTKAVMDAVQWYSQGDYTHCGVAIVVDGEPHVWHLTDDICWDARTHRWRVSRPTLMPARDLLAYHGVVYHFARIDAAPLDVAAALRVDGVMRGNGLATIIVNGMGAPVLDDHIVCTDFASRVLRALGVDAPTGACDLVQIAEVAQRECAAPRIVRNAWYAHAFEQSEM